MNRKTRHDLIHFLDVLQKAAGSGEENLKEFYATLGIFQAFFGSTLAVVQQ
jgi:hypothetical protein